MLKAVIFDLDGVITDSARYHFLAWKSLADRLGIAFDEAYNEKLKGVSRMESLDLILENGKQKDNFTEDEKIKMADEKNEEYKKLIGSMTPADILPGVKEFLEQLKENGIKTALASVSRNAFFIIDRLELNEYFDYIADAAKVEKAKPFPDIFLVGAKALSVDAEECVGVEDARAGIEAIKAAGMKAVGVGTAEQMKDADLILESTAQLSLSLIKDTFHM